MKYKYLLTAFLLCIIPLQKSISQTMILYNAEPAGYPVMKAKISVLDKNSKMVTNLQPDMFNLTVNDEPCDVISASCPEMVEPIPISSTLLIDVSGSMGAPNIIDSPLYHALEAARAWINAMDFSISECSIFSFNSVPQLLQEFTNDRTRLLTKTVDIEGGGGTSIQNALIAENGAVNYTSNGKYKKIIVLLTDCYAPVKEAEILNLLTQNNIALFLVNIDAPASREIRNIAESSGGMVFDRIPKEKLAEAFLNILQIASGITACDIFWKDTNCDYDKNMKLYLDDYNLKDSLNYNITPDTMKYFSIMPKEMLKFDIINPGNTQEKELTLKCLKEKAEIKKVTSSNPFFEIINWGGPPPPFFMNPGEERILTIQYKPDSVDYTIDFFTLETDACIDPEFFASGGLRGLKSTDNKLKIVFPNGGESLTGGGDTTASWEGVTPEDTFLLYYSLDSGNNWTQVQDTVTGLNYRWALPNAESDECLLKLTQILSYPRYERKIKTEHISTVSAVDWHPDNIKIATADAAGIIKVWNSITEQLLYEMMGGGSRIKKIEWDPEGTKLAIADGNTVTLFLPPDENALLTIKGNCFDWSPDGKYLAVGDGKYNQDNDWENLIKIIDPESGDELYAIKGSPEIPEVVEWSSNGSKIGAGYTLTDNNLLAIWEFPQGTASSTYSFGKSADMFLSWSPDQRQIAVGSGGISVVEIFNQKILYGINHGMIRLLGLEWSSRGAYIAGAGESGEVKMWDPANGEMLTPLLDYNMPVGFLAMSISPDETKIACGDIDRFLNIWDAVTPYQTDVSDSVFSISKPRYLIKNIDMKKCLVGNIKDSVITDFIFNLSKFPVKVDSITIRGKDSSAFAMIGGIPEYTIGIDSSAHIEISFFPARAGLHEAEIHIHAMREEKTVILTGTGVEDSLDFPKIIDFGMVKVDEGSEREETVAVYYGELSADFSKIELKNNSLEEFSIVEGEEPFSLNSENNSKIMKLAFVPKTNGAKQAVLKLHHNLMGSPAEIILMGTGEGEPGEAVIRAGNVTSETGKIVTIPIFLEDTVGFFKSNVSEIQTKMKFNATLLVPWKETPEGTIHNGIREITVSMPYMPDDAGKIGEFSFISTLGNAESTDIILEESKASPGALRFTEKPGSFTLSDICYEGGKRLVFKQSDFYLLCLPNPAGEKCVFEYGLVENANFTIKIFDIYGKMVKLVEEGFQKAGTYKKEADLSDLSGGVYYIRLKSPALVLTKKLLILK